MGTVSNLNSATHNSGLAALRYLNCELFSVCIFIRIQSPLGGKSLGINYHYKPANYLLDTKGNEGKNTAPTGDEATQSHYHVVFGSERRGTVSLGETSDKIVALTSVGANRKWIKELDGTPVIDYIDGTKKQLHPCSRRGLCDFDTGRCECFFGYMGNSCHVRT